MGRLRRFLDLPPPERGLLIQAGILVCAVRLGLWLLPFQMLRRLVARAAQAPAGVQEADQASLKRAVWTVEVASHHVPGANTCLVQALAGQVLLARRGYPVRLRIGVAKGEEGQLEAHAWLDSQGEIVIGGEESPSRFTAFPNLEGERPSS